MLREKDIAGKGTSETIGRIISPTQLGLWHMVTEHKAESVLEKKQTDENWRQAALCSHSFY